ncbi:exopolyphosphatase [Thiolapillus brandeum]|uniref:Exopolyphosphatase n=1 Tax=Thiolapillus brandeum TaxID=1076588 RepID=A0A7U6GJE4_9GAMM|nr:exopolyphosphatase [Thiolapillus brandeum]BAO44791.1 guanosine-5'-triphosphate3'-diphosphate diphosphatase [Thiolapillus brandeum]
MSTTPSALPKTIAAVDLGSNSFHLIVAQMENGQLQVIDRIKEMVRLGAGLDNRKRLTPEARERALDCLSRFGQRLSDLPRNAVRAVGTNTLRQVRDGGEFLRQAEEALKHPIEIIAGHEEARLVYLGVAHGLAGDEDKRLVVDIGGGSTELITGSGMETRERESLFMGCVSFSQRFFPEGRISSQMMDAAIIAGRLEARPVQTIYDSHHWDLAVGSSGTIRSIRDVVQAQGWSDKGISKKSLKKLRKAVVEAGHVNKLKLDGLSDNRRPVFPGGVAVLSAVFKALDIEQMRVSDLALREGLLYELLGSIQHHDVRERTVTTLTQRYSLDSNQGRQVADTSRQLLEQVLDSWSLEDEELHLLLKWSALLHEIGMAISHDGYHKHGAYILANADLSGFSRQFQNMLALLVRSHRRKFRSSSFSELGKDMQESCRRLTILLRLSVLLHRGRSPHRKPSLDIMAQKNNIVLSFPNEWLDSHPLTKAELEREAKYLDAAGYFLSYS